MSDEGKYPFEGTPSLREEFSADKNENQENEVKVEEQLYETPVPAPKPSWDQKHLEFTKIEEQLPYIIQENYRSPEQSQEQQNYDVIKDNNIDVEVDLKGEWDEKTWEAPAPEIGDD